METFDVRSDKTLVNVISNDNKLLKSGDECYFLLTTITDYHLPIICKGTIFRDEYRSVMDKQYYIIFQEFIDNSEEQKAEKYIYGKIFEMFYYMVNNGELIRKRLILSREFSTPKYFNTSEYKKLFKVNAFFTRQINKNDIQQSIDVVKTFRKEYVEYIIKDLEKSIFNAKAIL